ncbi:MAG: hypothetical protein H7144_01945 [Burkholderiales bacterium]|nr:hypothetical protein [Phycisphaerae bacterium]
MHSGGDSRFDERAQSIFTRLRERPLTILIWGPGEGSPAFTKRSDLKRELRAEFPSAEIHFSEDEQARLLTRDKFLYIHQEEFVHACAADIIFALDTAKGVGEEIAKYSTYAEIASKLVVLAHARWKGVGSYAEDVRVPLRVHWYPDDDFDNCNLAKLICKKYVWGWLLQHYGHNL